MMMAHQAKNPHVNAGDSGDVGSVPGSGRFPGEGIGFPLQDSWASLVAQTVKNLLQCRRPGFDPWGWDDPLEDGMATHSSIHAWKIPRDREAWWATVHGVAESRTRLSD